MDSFMNLSTDHILSEIYKSSKPTHKINFVEGKPSLTPREKCIHLAYFEPAVGHVPNPGMGINAYIFSDHMHVGYTREEWNRTESTIPLQLDRKTVDTMMALPYTDNIYIRVEWRDMQKAAGKLELPTAWQWLIEAAEKYGKRWSFRVMNCSPHSLAPHSLPEFLGGRLEMIPYWHNNKMPGPQLKYFAKYSDEYLKWWNELLQLLGEKFDSHPLLEFADVSGYGLWGEGHHCSAFTQGGSLINYQCDTTERLESVVERLINDHLNAFPKTPAVISMHMTEYQAGRQALEQSKCWLRRDSFMTTFSTNETSFASGMNYKGACLWETILPGCVELSEGKSPSQDFMQLPQRYFDIGACYAAVGFNPWDVIYAHNNCSNLYKVLASRIGYRIRPSIIWRRCIDNEPEQIVFGFVNDGCAAPPGEITVHANFSNGQMTSLILPENEPTPGGIKLYAMDIPKSENGQYPEGSVRLSLSIRIKGKTTNVQWAVRSDQTTDSFVLEIPLYSI